MNIPPIPGLVALPHSTVYNMYLCRIYDIRTGLHTIIIKTKTITKKRKVCKKTINSFISFSFFTLTKQNVGMLNYIFFSLVLKF